MAIALPQFVNLVDRTFDHQKLHQITKVVTCNLNRIIDINFYPTDKTKKSNLLHRPIGIGIQGLADVFMLMNYPFDSDEAKLLNRQIFQTLYHASLEKSMEIAKETKQPYSSFIGSPISKGILQFDMWNYSIPNEESLYDWNVLRNEIMQHGLRNSLLLAPMPTASTSQILGFNECFEPFTSNKYIVGCLL